MSAVSLHQIAKAIRLFACNAFVGAMSSPRGKVGAALYDRMKHPVIGDLVAECSSTRRSTVDNHINAVGKLLEQYGTSYRIQTLDGREEQWHNAFFIAVVEEPF